MRQKIKKKKISNHEIAAELKKMRQEKKVIKPGPYTSLHIDFEVDAELRINKSIFDSIPDFSGKYLTHDSNYQGDGNLAIVNLVVKQKNELIKQYGKEKFLSAVEKSLLKNSVLGDVAITKVLDLREEKDYFTVEIKTNKKHIPGFLGLQEGILKVFS